MLGEGKKFELIILWVVSCVVGNILLIILEFDKRSGTLETDKIFDLLLFLTTNEKWVEYTKTFGFLLEQFYYTKKINSKYSAERF